MKGALSIILGSGAVTLMLMAITTVQDRPWLGLGLFVLAIGSTAAFAWNEADRIIEGGR